MSPPLDDGDDPLSERIAERLAHLSPTERAIAEARLGRILTRRKAMTRYRTPTELALGLGGPSVVVTPMTRMLDSVLVSAESGWRTRWIVNTPPQEGKTMTINQWGMLWLLLRDPGRRIGVASYEQNIAARSGLQVRQWVEAYGSGYAGGKVGVDHEDHLGLLLDPRRSQSTAWSLSGVHGENGGMVCVGIGSALTGRAINVLVVDDPLKDAEQADSLIYRERVWNWWQSVASTRLSGHTIVIVVQCLTGDTPVLMSDGTERPLRDVRPGDEVATYEHGALTTATVRRAANQGPDRTYRVRMISGVEVRGNERHPFLVRDDDGVETWRRLRDLRPGDAIVRVTRPGEASPDCSATTSPDAPSPRSARASACPTTTAPAGPPDTARPRPAPSPDEPPTSSTGTGSPSSSTTPPSPSRTAAAQSAGDSPRSATSPRTGATSSPSTTTTTPASSGGCSATTATSSSPEATPPNDSTTPLPTSVTTDRVLEIARSVDEDVYDLEIERTENFIAAGLCVHNTRWHEDDLSGRLMNEDNLRPHPRWSRLVIPAQAEEGDPLGRVPGEWLTSVWGRDEAEWLEKRDSVGNRWWFAMYQQRPAPPAGGVFEQAWFDRYRVRAAPELVYSGVWVDPADNVGTGDECGVIFAGLGADGRVYVVEDASDHMTVHQMLRRALLICTSRRGHVVRLEQSLSGLRRNAEKAWRDIRFEAGVLLAHWRADVRARGLDPDDVPWPTEAPADVVTASVDHVARDDDGPLARADIETALTGSRRFTDHDVVRYGLWPLVPAILDLPRTGPPVTVFAAKGTKTWRAKNASGPYERGDVSHVGPKGRLEHQMVSWMESQDSPDRMDADVHAVTELSAKAGGADVGKGDTRIPARTHTARGTIVRSTRR